MGIGSTHLASQVLLITLFWKDAFDAICQLQKIRRLSRQNVEIETVLSTLLALENENWKMSFKITSEILSESVE